MQWYGVKANLKAPHKFLRMGGLCWLYNINPGWGNERIQIIGRSRGGRPVHTWVHAQDLKNYRAAWISDDPDYFRRFDKFPFDTREEAQAWADQMNARWGDGAVRPHAAAFGGSTAAKATDLHATDDAEREAWALGDYVSDPCPNCGRQRLCECQNGKHRCEKCNWCPEDGAYAPVNS